MCPEDYLIDYVCFHNNVRYERWRSFYKYNLLPLLNPGPDQGNLQPHVEFRQHQGTLNATEMQHWILFVCSMVQLAECISDASLMRLVHINDRADVNIMELFLLMSVGQNETSNDMMEMINHYSRKIMARSGPLKIHTRLRLMGGEAGARRLAWKELRPQDVIGVSSTIRSWPTPDSTPKTVTSREEYPGSSLLPPSSSLPPGSITPPPAYPPPSSSQPPPPPAPIGKGGSTLVGVPVISRPRPGLYNLGNTCYLSAVLQLLAACEPLMAALPELDVDKDMNPKIYPNDYRTFGAQPSVLVALVREISCVLRDMGNPSRWHAVYPTELVVCAS